MALDLNKLNFFTPAMRLVAGLEALEIKVRPAEPDYLHESEMDAEQLEELDAALDDLYAYHPFSVGQIISSNKIKDALKAAHRAILLHAPASPNRTRALNCLVDARMLANAAITFKGRV